MSLYRQDATGFVCEFATSPGSGYTLISAQPTDTLANRVNWWRDVDVGNLTSTWHPSEIAGPEVPGRDTNAGSGINLMPNDYASFEWAGSMPPNYTSGMTVNRTAAATYHGQYGVRLTTTSAGGTVWLAASGSVFNIALSPSSKWIVSAYVRPLTNAAVSGTLRLKTQGGTTHSASFTSGASSSGWVRVSGVFDLSADTSEFGQLGISLTNNSTSLDIDALMLEEKIGPYDTASVWYSPWGNGLSDGEIGPGTVTQDKLFGSLSSRIDLIDASSLIPGSVNARLASQYDTLVQQISEVSVGNGQFDSKIIWYFDQSSEITGWTGTSASLAVSGGYLTVTGTGSNPKFKTATIAVDGSAYQLVRLRVKRTGGSGWNGTLRYYYAGGSNTISLAEPAQIGSEYVEASWDMAGLALWTANTITAVEIQLGTGSGDNYSIDWMGVGRNAPGASYSQVEAVRVLSDNKTRVFYQTTAPASGSNYTLKANDLWFDTDDGNKPYRWTGSAWAETTDTRLADSWAEILDIRNATANPSGAAAQRINGISATASSKNRTFYQASTSSPASPTTGDLWYQTDQGNKAFRWNGSAWVETTDTRLPAAVSSITNIETAKIGYCTIGGNTSVHGTKSACEAAGGTWNVGLPWATAVKQVSITAGNGQSATVQQQFEAIYGAGGLRAQYSVKLDVNGYVAGFGLYNEGAGASGFIVRADKFVVGSAGSNVVPFEVVSGTTYIKAAMIKDASITSAKIGTLNADKITGGFLDMARINTGAITAEKIDSRGLSIKDASGNVILAAGTPLSSGNITPAAGWLNSNVTLLGLGYTGAFDATRNTVWQQATAPTSGVSSGDFWVDTDDGNKLYLRSGSTWVLRRDAGIDAALTAAASAQDTADGKIDSFYQTTAPASGMTLGDLWFDTDDGNKLYRYNGSSWVVAQDQSIGTAINDAATAQATADGKITTYFGTSAPAGTKAFGDLWYNDSTKLLQRWTGSAWVTVSNAYTNTNQLTDGAGLGTTANWATVAGRPTTLAALDATAASDLDGKTVTFYQTSAPSGTVNDLWFDTDDGNKLYRYNGSTWVVVQDAGIAAAASLANTAQATADGKITTYYSTTAPSGTKTTGDLWYNSSTRVLQRWNGSAWATTGNYVENTNQLTDGAGLGSTANWSNIANVPAFGGFAYLSSITSANISTYIAGAAIGTAYIADAAITSAKIADASITNADIANATITGAKIATATIATANIGDLQVTNAKIANLSVDSYKIADAAITTAKIGDAQITGAKIGSATITSANIANATITAADIANATITGAKIANATITDANIASLNASKITAGTITADKISAGTITADKIIVGGITTDRIGENAVTEILGGGNSQTIYPAIGSWIVSASQSLPANSNRGKVIIQWTVSVAQWHGQGINVYLRVKKGSTVVSGFVGANGSASLFYIDSSPSTGTQSYTFEIYWVDSLGDYDYNGIPRDSYLYVMDVKR